MALFQRKKLKPELEATIGQWEFVCCETWIHIATSISTHITQQCQGCGNTNIRFLHTLQHAEDKTRQITVGIECARVLLDDSEVPRLAENEVKRKEKWRVHYKKPGRCWVDIQDLV